MRGSTANDITDKSYQYMQSWQSIRTPDLVPRKSELATASVDPVKLFLAMKQRGQIQQEPERVKSYEEMKRAKTQAEL